MNTILRARTGGALGHLLLVLLLALGVFAMHTTGHPEESHGSATTSEAVSASHATTPSATGMTHEPQEPVITAERAPDPTDAVSPAGSGMAMDMAGLCLAVLAAAWVIAALVRAAYTRHIVQVATLIVRAALVEHAGPLRRAPDLAELSVLRL